MTTEISKTTSGTTSSPGQVSMFQKPIHLNPLPTDSRMETFKQKLVELIPYPESGLSVFQKIKDIAEAIGHAFVHLPGIGLITASISKKRIAKNTDQAIEQFKAADQTRMKILMVQKRPERLDPLSIKRGIRPSDFWQAGGNQFGTSLLLANTIEYAQIQINKRLEKLGISNEATKVQAMGATIGMVATPVGIGLSIAGLGTKLLIKLKSGFTFLSKLFAGTLGRDRNEHAALLYGLALKDQKKTHEAGDDPNVEKALNFIEPLKNTEFFSDSCMKASVLLQKLGIDPTSTDFKKNGFQKIREFLKS